MVNGQFFFVFVERIFDLHVGNGVMGGLTEEKGGTINNGHLIQCRVLEMDGLEEELRKCGRKNGLNANNFNGLKSDQDKQIIETTLKIQLSLYFPTLQILNLTPKINLSEIIATKDSITKTHISMISTILKPMSQKQQYDPFLYPPNYELARLHKRASMPGTSITPHNRCPCCHKKQRLPFKEWISRSIDQDFKNYGGSVVTYFWLLKLYIAVITLVIIFYSIYLTVVIHQNCSLQIADCKKMLGIWIVSNQTLIQLLNFKQENDTKVRLLTLRGIAFIILMLANALSLIVVKKFKKIHPTKISIADYSLIFKNTNLQEQEMILKLKLQFPDVQIKEILKIYAIEPFYTEYRNKLDTYYQTLNIAGDDKKSQKLRKQLIKRLRRSNELCKNSQETFHSKKGERIIVVFESIDQRQAVLEKYKRSNTQKFKTLFQNSDETYCHEAPRPEQIIWHNIGSGDQYRAKYKIISILYFFGGLALCYLILYLCMAIVYNEWFEEPWNTIVINIILFFLVYMALTFRAFMNKLSELSHPSTYTYRTMFIVVTTISFHLLFYLIIPTAYFSGAGTEENRNQVLKMISNQVLNFIIFQFIITGVDLMHCCWNKKLKMIEDESKPYACQALLHEAIQYPRFPIEFKLIILFKLWSFTMFFSFQSPFILFFLGAVMIFLFIKDKHSLYFHYRMEVIDNKVQFGFLKIYTTFFSLYGFLVFVLTQHLEIEFWLAAAFTVFMIGIQLLYIGRNFETRQSRSEQNGSLLLPPSFEELQKKGSYRNDFVKFVSRIQSDRIDAEINEFLTGEQSIISEQMLAE